MLHRVAPCGLVSAVGGLMRALRNNGDPVEDVDGLMVAVPAEAGLHCSFIDFPDGIAYFFPPPDTP
jgi:hypothetical protein